MKYAVVFSALAATLACNAWIQATADDWPAGLALAWCAVALALVAIAYWVEDPRIFGKRPDGRLDPLRVLVLLPFHALANLLWRLNTRLTREAPWHRINARLVVGRRLHAHEIPAGLGSVLDLTGEFREIPGLRALAASAGGVGYRCLPLLDGAAAPPAVLADAARALAAVPGTLCIHCAQGHGRTGLVAALVLIAREPGLTPEQALARLQAIRPGIGLNRRQTAALRAAAALLHGPGDPQRSRVC